MDDTCDLPFDEVAPNIPAAYIVDDQGKPLHSTSATDVLINSEVMIPQGEELRLSKVIQSIVDLDGKLGGNYDDIPILNTILYDVQFLDGGIKLYSENLIA